MASYYSCMLFVGAILLVSSNLAWAASSNTINSACSNALYKDFCISSLSNAPGALQADLTQLSVIAVDLGIAEAKQVSGVIADLTKQNPGVSALKDCSELFQDTNDRLEESKSELKQLSSANFQSFISDVQTWLSGVANNPDTCVTGLKETNGSNLVSAVQEKTDNLTKLISDALAVVSKLSEQGRP